MYQTIIRAPAFHGPVAVWNDTGPVTDGSVLIVPSGARAYLDLSGQLLGPYSPGRYTLNPGTDPLFVRLRHLATGGQVPASLTVFFIADGREFFLQFGTDALPFTEQRFQLTINVLASCSVTLHVRDPLVFLRKLVGSYASDFSPEDVEPHLIQLLLPSVRELLADKLQQLPVTCYNQQLTALSRRVLPALRTALACFGLEVPRFSVTAVNVAPEDLAQLKDLECKESAGHMENGLLRERSDVLFHGNHEAQVLSELLKSLPAGGGGGAGSLLPLMLYPQLMDSLRGALPNLFSSADLLGGVPRGGGSSDAPPPGQTPPLPPNTCRCPSCNGSIPRAARVCPVCGFRLR